jgi:hypothetical protein
MVSLELTVNDDSKYCMSLYISVMSVNEMATQSIWQHHYPECCGGTGALWDKLTNKT